MGNDRKHIRKVRKKRISSVEKQIDRHEEKIKKEKGRKDTTVDYWKKEINEKFSKQVDEDKGYLEEN